MKGRALNNFHESRIDRAAPAFLTIVRGEEAVQEGRQTSRSIASVAFFFSTSEARTISPLISRPYEVTVAPSGRGNWRLPSRVMLWRLVNVRRTVTRERRPLRKISAWLTREGGQDLICAVIVASVSSTVGMFSGAFTAVMRSGENLPGLNWKTPRSETQGDMRGSATERVRRSDGERRMRACPCRRACR